MGRLAPSQAAAPAPRALNQPGGPPGSGRLSPRGLGGWRGGGGGGRVKRCIVGVQRREQSANTSQTCFFFFTGVPAAAAVGEGEGEGLRAPPSPPPHLPPTLSSLFTTVGFLYSCLWTHI